MSNTTLCLVTLASLAGTIACTDRPPTAPASVPTASGAGASAVASSPQARSEALARGLALALGDRAFRAHLKARLDGSTFREHKLHFQRFLAADGASALQTIGRSTGTPATTLAAEAAVAPQLEMYLPVPLHRALWRGDANVLVATALADHDTPVAFDTRGNRLLLNPDRPPATPVIALVPVETDFTPQPSPLICLGCGGGGGGVPPVSPPPPTPGLYMTKAHFVDGFEGWLKGSPEFEAHILGQKGATDSLTDYQCAGEHAAGPYYFDQNGLDWSGNVLLFSGAQIASYNAAHPGQNFRVFFVEDDDTACEIKADKDLVSEFLKGVDGANGFLTAGNDSSNTISKTFKRAQALQKLWAAITTLIKTNDELIGNGVEDAVVAAFYDGFNWIVKGQNNATNGWVNLEIK